MRRFNIRIPSSKTLTVVSRPFAISLRRFSEGLLLPSSMSLKNEGDMFIVIPNCCSVRPFLSLPVLFYYQRPYFLLWSTNSNMFLKSYHIISSLTPVGRTDIMPVFLYSLFFRCRRFIWRFEYTKLCLHKFLFVV